MKIELTASLQGAGCLRFDDDGSCVVKLTIDGSQMPEAVKLLTLQGSAFTLKIDTKG
jgi:hypothetical protein